MPSVCCLSLGRPWGLWCIYHISNSVNSANGMYKPNIAWWHHVVLGYTGVTGDGKVSLSIRKIRCGFGIWNCLIPSKWSLKCAHIVPYESIFSWLYHRHKSRIRGGSSHRFFFEVINKPGDRKSRMTYSDITVVELTIWLQTLTLVSIIYIYIIYKWLKLQLCSLPMVAITTVFQVLTDSESDDELQSPTQATEPSTVWKINGLKR